MSKPNLAEAINLAIGSGQTLLGFEDSNGNVPNFKYRAQSAITLSVTPSTSDIPDDDSPSAENLLTVQNGTVRGGSLIIKDWTEEMEAAFLLGTASTHSQASTPVVDQPQTASLGSYLYLGRSASNPTGDKNVSSVVVTDSTGVTTYVAGTDYVTSAEDLKKGRIWIPATGSSISEGESLLVDYTPAAESRSRVASGGLTAKTAWLIFDSDYSNGDAEEIVIPKVKLIPAGEITLKDRENPRAMQFDLKIETRTGYEQVYIDREAA